jgi:hypothetical protein
LGKQRNFNFGCRLYCRLHCSIIIGCDHFVLPKSFTIKTEKTIKSYRHRAADAEDLSISGEASAAISTALYLHFQEKHDLENTVLTIKRIQRAYSPWSSKLYGIREYPKKQR